MTSIEDLNQMKLKRLKEVLSQCCGSSSYSTILSQMRPYTDLNDLIEKSNHTWYNLPHEDWLEAFSKHPKIGDLDKLKAKYSQHTSWSSNEQKGVNKAQEEILKRLARKNNEYYDKFGFIFIVFATGKTAEEMLKILETRLNNERMEEIEIAGREQNKITRLRLHKLISSAE